MNRPALPIIGDKFRLKLLRGLVVTYEVVEIYPRRQLYLVKMLAVTKEKKGDSKDDKGTL